MEKKMYHGEVDLSKPSCGCRSTWKSKGNLTEIDALKEAFSMAYTIFNEEDCEIKVMSEPRAVLDEEMSLKANTSNFRIASKWDYRDKIMYGNWEYETCDLAQAAANKMVSNDYTVEWAKPQENGINGNISDCGYTAYHVAPISVMASLKPEEDMTLKATGCPTKYIGFKVADLSNIFSDCNDSANYVNSFDSLGEAIIEMEALIKNNTYTEVSIYKQFENSISIYGCQCSKKWSMCSSVPVMASSKPEEDMTLKAGIDRFDITFWTDDNYTGLNVTYYNVWNSRLQTLINDNCGTYKSYMYRKSSTVNPQKYYSVCSCAIEEPVMASPKPEEDMILKAENKLYRIAKKYTNISNLEYSGYYWSTCDDAQRGAISAVKANSALEWAKPQERDVEANICRDCGYKSYRVAPAPLEE